jgi:hypothetical protein
MFTFAFTFAFTFDSRRARFSLDSAVDACNSTAE